MIKLSVGLYDQAIVNDFRRIFHNGNIFISDTEETFDLLAKVDRDDIKFPIISLTRTGWSLTDNRPHSLKFEGSVVDIREATDDPDEDYKIVRRIQAIPIIINYNIDVWTESRRQNDDIMRELIFYYSTSPTLSVKVPYGAKICHHFNLFFNSEVEDNSDIPAHKNRGRYFRQTIGMYTDDAYLWNTFTRLPTVVREEDVKVFIEYTSGKERSIKDGQGIQ